MSIWFTVSAFFLAYSTYILSTRNSLSFSQFSIRALCECPEMVRLAESLPDLSRIMHIWWQSSSIPFFAYRPSTTSELLELSERRPCCTQRTNHVYGISPSGALVDTYEWKSCIEPGPRPQHMPGSEISQDSGDASFSALDACFESDIRLHHVAVWNDLFEDLGICSCQTMSRSGPHSDVQLPLSTINSSRHVF